MANNKTTIKTLPLDLKLNMNKNEQLVDSTYSMVNKNNSPVYGSTLTNIHVSTQEKGNAIWDRKGERYYVEDGVLLSTNKNFDPIDLSDKYFFEKSSIDKDIDGIAFCGLEGLPTAFKYKNYYSAFKLDSGKIKLYLGDTIESLDEEITVEPYSSDYNIVCARLVPINERLNWTGDEFDAGTYDVSLYTILFTIQESTIISDNDKDSTTARNKLLVAYGINNDNGFNVVKLGAVPIVLGQLASDSINKTLTSSVENKTGTNVKQTATTNSNYQIIVSSVDFKGKRSWTSNDLTKHRNSRGPTFGITILKNKMKASNVTTDLFYDNLLTAFKGNWNSDLLDDLTMTFYNWTLGEDSKDSFELTNSGKYLTVGTSIRSNDIEVRTVPQPIYNTTIKARNRSRSSTIAYSNSAKTQITETYASNTQGYGGIFIDETPYILAVKPTGVNGCLLGTVTWTSTLTNTVYKESDTFNVEVGAVENLAYPNTQTYEMLELLKTMPKNFVGAFIGSRQKYGVPNTFAGWSLTTNQRYARLLVYGKNTGNDETNKNNVGSMMIDTAKPDTVFTAVGLQSTQTIPTTSAGWSNWSTSQNTDSNYVCYNSQGSSVQISNTNWRLLFNYKEGYVSGISYGQSGLLGKLVTEWDSIDDGFYVYADSENVVYKNTRNNKVYKVTRKAFSDIPQEEWINKFTLVDERYLIGNVDVELNAFDTIENNKSNWGNDWNNRVFAGVAYSVNNRNYSEVTWQVNSVTPTPDEVTAFANSNTQTFSPFYFRLWNTIVDDGVKNWVNNGSLASGVNVAYAATKSFAPSRLEAYQSYTGLLFGFETFINAGSSEGLDLYEAKTATTPVYRYTVKLDSYGSTYTFNETVMEGLNYPVAPTGSSYQNIPIVGVDFIESYNGKFAVRIDNTVYGIVYNGIRPIGLYNTASLTDDVDEFFIVQGQYYALVNGYISAVYYNNSGTLSSIEQIINVNGMKFVGAFPSVAYFYAPSTSSIYAFTGDADLQLFVQSNRIKEVYNYLYDPSSEWILLNTNDGLYVLTQINVFKSSYLTNVKNFYSTDDGFIVVIWDDDYKNTRLALRKLDDTYKTIPIELETVFYGPGNLKVCNSTVWYIRLYRNDEDYNGELSYSVSTLTDTVREGKTKTIKLTKEKWDSQDNFFIRAQPDLEKGQGTSLKIKSDYPIALIAVEVSENSTQLSKYNF